WRRLAGEPAGAQLAGVHDGTRAPRAAGRRVRAHPGRGLLPGGDQVGAWRRRPGPPRRARWCPEPALDVGDAPPVGEVIRAAGDRGVTELRQVRPGEVLDAGLGVRASELPGELVTQGARQADATADGVVSVRAIRPAERERRLS